MKLTNGRIKFVLTQLVLNILEIRRLKTAAFNWIQRSNTIH